MGGLADNGIPETIQLKTLTEGQERALNQMLRGVMGSLGGLELGTPYGGALESSYSPYTPEYRMEGEAVPKDGDGGGDGGDVIRKEQLSEKRPITKEQLTAPDGGTVNGGDGKTVIRNGTVAPKTVLDEILNIVQARQEPTLPRDWTLPTGGGEPIPPKFDPAFPSLPIGIEPYGQPSTGLPPPPDAGRLPTGIEPFGPSPAGMPPAGGEQEMLSQLLKSILSPSPPMPFSPVNVPPAADVLPPEAQPVSPIQQLLTQPFTQPFREGMTGNYPGPMRR